MKTFIKRLYRSVPFKMELYKLIKIIWRPHENIYKHLHFIGVFKVKTGDGNSFKIKHYGFQIENQIFWEGLTNGWEKESMKVWIKLCQRSKMIFDIGANTGVYSLVAKTVNPSSKVHAFEPVNRVFEKLEENILLNEFDVVPVKKAISNADGFAIIYDRPGEHIYSVTVNKNLASPETIVSEVQIETIKLDTYIKQTGIEKIDLMKVDVETHEPEVLEGFLDNLFKFKPVFLLEILNDEVGKNVESIMRKTGYSFFYIDESKGVSKVKEIIARSNGYNYLFCDSETAQEIGLED